MATSQYYVILCKSRYGRQAVYRNSVSLLILFVFLLLIFASNTPEVLNFSLDSELSYTVSLNFRMTPSPFSQAYLIRSQLPTNKPDLPSRAGSRAGNIRRQRALTIDQFLLFLYPSLDPLIRGLIQHLQLFPLPKPNTA